MHGKGRRKGGKEDGIGGRKGSGRTAKGRKKVTEGMAKAGEGDSKNGKICRRGKGRRGHREHGKKQEEEGGQGNKVAG